MDEQRHKTLLEDIESLRRLVGSHSTEGVIRAVLWYNLARGNMLVEDNPLASPTRQTRYLLGLTLAAPEPETPGTFGSNEWREAVRLLNRVYNAYTVGHIDAARRANDEEEARERVTHAMAFAHYFHSSVVATVEQLEDRVLRYLSPFDAEVKDALGLTATEGLRACSEVFRTLDEGFRWATSPERSEDQLMWVGTIERDSLSAAVGEDVASAFWRVFVSRRGENALLYPTDHSDIDERPLIEVEDGVASCPLVNDLYEALLRVGERALLEGVHRQSYLRQRDRLLEEEVEGDFRSLFGDAARYFRGVFETEDLHFEHDLVIVWERTALVVEAKASPPTEPFRDPALAYKRIRQAFRSDTGIQKAFEQAERVRSQLAEGHSVSLYSKGKGLVARLEPGELDRVLCVCVTRDDFGPLAADLSRLLVKDEGVPYPWAVSALRLHELVEGFHQLGWGPGEFVRYLDERERMHGRILGIDELEFAGFWVEHGGLLGLLDAVPEAMLHPHYSDVFDRLSLYRRDGIEVHYRPRPYPPLTGTAIERRSGSAREVISGAPVLTTETRRPGRNEPCTCGSGLKYKRCCGRPGGTHSAPEPPAAIFRRR